MKNTLELINNVIDVQILFFSLNDSWKITIKNYLIYFIIQIEIDEPKFKFSLFFAKMDEKKIFILYIIFFNFSMKFILE
jgi:hypothetical protein